MKKKRTGPLTWLLRVAYMFWGLWNRMMFPPRFVYASPEAKKMMRRPCIFYANHTAHTDGFYIPQILPGKCPYTYVTNKWYDKPKLNWIFRRLNYIPVNAADMDTAWLSRGAEVLAGGGRVLFFPEGKLAQHGEIEEFHPGFLMLAKQTGVPVIPVALCGPYRKFHRKTILVGAPMELHLTEKGRPSAILRRAAASCRVELASLLGIRIPEIQGVVASELKPTTLTAGSEERKPDLEVAVILPSKDDCVEYSKEENNADVQLTPVH